MSRNHIAWCFTLNNYSDDDVAFLRSIDPSKYSYLIFGREAASTGTLHLQGYLRLAKRGVFNAVKALLPEGSHIEPSRGTAVSNRNYCSKEGDFEELGTFPSGRGVAGSLAVKNRNVLASEFRDSLHNGREGLVKFVDENPGCWFFSGHNLLRNYVSCNGPIERPDIHVSWYHGAPGVGKSRRAHEELPRAFIKEPRTKWWSGYMLEKEVIIDDFGPNGIDINHLLRWFDRYKCLVETKGGMSPLHANKFIVTSNFTPQECYYDRLRDSDHPQIDALLRRINVIAM